MPRLAISTVLVGAFVLLGCDRSGGEGGSGGEDFDDGFGDGFDDGFDPCAPRLFQTISSNHGHAIEENEGVVEGFATVTFTLGGRNAGHSHAIEVTEAQLEQIFNGGAISVETTSNSLHTHRVTAGITFPPGCDFDDGVFDEG